MEPTVLRHRKAFGPLQPSALERMPELVSVEPRDTRMPPHDPSERPTADYRQKSSNPHPRLFEQGALQRHSPDPT
jgi:hypothetical protein